MTSLPIAPSHHTGGEVRSAPRVPNPGTPPNELPPSAAAVIFTLLGALAYGSGLGWASMLDALTFQPSASNGSYAPSASVYGSILPIAATLYYVAAQFRQGWVSVSERGVDVESRARTRHVAWSSLQPLVPLRGSWAGFTIGSPSRPATRFLYVTKDQARTMLRHPAFPSDRFPKEYWEWAGLPSIRGGEVSSEADSA